MRAYRQGLTRIGVTATLALALTLGLASNASAAFKMTLDDPGVGVGPEVSLTDADLDGVLTHLGSVGGFLFSASTGLSKPTAGSAVDPKMLLAGVFVISFSPGTLVISLTDDHFMTPSGLATASIGGVTRGMVTYEAYWDAGDGEFVPTSQIGSTLSFGPPAPDDPALAFSGGTSGSAGDEDGYSLTQVVTIVHGHGLNVTGLSTKLTHYATVPEPASLSLLGMGLTALAMVSRRRQLWTRA